MSDQDRQRWNKRYHDGSYSARTYPSPFLLAWHENLQLTNSRNVLDVGCGAGRNSLYLARQGHNVTGYDISQVALTRARQNAIEQQLTVTFEEVDLDQQTPPAKSWDLVVMIRFMNRTLQSQLPGLLKAGGILLVEHHVTTNQNVHGPQPPKDDAFRLRPNEILNNCSNLHVIHYSEHCQIDVDNKSVALAQLVATTTPLHMPY